MSERLNNIVKQRQEKLSRIRSQGIEPYPHRYHRTNTIAESRILFTNAEPFIKEAPQDFRLAGRIMAKRRMGMATFCDIQDGSGKIQVYFRSDFLGKEKYTLLLEWDIGDIIGVEGKILRTRSGEITLEASDLILLSKSLHPLPEKWHGLMDTEKRYRQRYLDLLANEEIRALFTLRSRIISSIRHFLEQRDFLEVETPVLQPTAGGALARPFVTHHNSLNQNLFLRIALELHLKRLIIGGLDKVFEIGRVFRNEGISIKHNPEFTMLESYEAYADYNDVLSMVEEMIPFVAIDVLGTTEVKFRGDAINLSPPWSRLTLRQAIKDGCGIDFMDYRDADSLRIRMAELGLDVDPARGKGKLIDELLSTFVEPKLVQPTFIIDYPVEMSPLAKTRPDDSRLVERFEAFIGGMEMANAFTELNDPSEQRERFRQQQKEREAGDDEAELADEDFLLALEYGMPPTGGLGVGIDRLVMLLSDQQSIRDVIMFPQLRTVGEVIV